MAIQLGKSRFGTVLRPKGIACIVHRLFTRRTHLQLRIQHDTAAMLYTLLLVLGASCLFDAQTLGLANGVEDVYLFATFKEPEQDGLRFAFSFDGFNWTNIDGVFLRPRVGSGIMRDPSIVRGPDGRYHLVWTTAWRGDRGFGYACSKDLVHWDEQRFIPVMEHEPHACNVWAPEIFYDKVAERFIIVWATTIPGRFALGVEAPTNNHRLFYTTTKDFVIFTPAKLFFDPGYSVIDGYIVSLETNYVLIFKDNTRPERNLKVAFGNTPVGPWADISESLTEHLTEGPCAVKVGGGWLIYYDAYGKRAYGALFTTDFRKFENVTEKMRFPPGLKHGTVVKISKAELEYILRNRPAR